MTKKFHRCDQCKGINGVYVKICEATGEIIEDYKTQYERIKKDLNYVKPDWKKT